VVSLEVRRSSVTEHADVVLPVAPPAEKTGSFMDWEGRLRPFDTVVETDALSDHAVLDELAHAMGVELGAAKAVGLRDELGQIGAWDDARVPAPDVAPGSPAVPRVGQAVLATWHLLLDAGRGQDGEAYLTGTAHRAHARLSPVTAAATGILDGGYVRVSAGTGTAAGALLLPVRVDPSVVDGVVWVPTRSRRSEVRARLGAGSGDLVGIAPAPAPDQLATGDQA
jgi:NADH-quinone oxidoreductase subunit G